MELTPNTARRELEEARESLEYWERRERSPGRKGRAARREAREHVERCRIRVAELERAAYGSGVAGALAQISAEGRLPEPARHAGRTLARRGRKALVITAIAVGVTTVAAVTVVILILLAVFGAL